MAEHWQWQLPHHHHHCSINPLTYDYEQCTNPMTSPLFPFIHFPRIHDVQWVSQPASLSSFPRHTHTPLTHKHWDTYRHHSYYNTNRSPGFIPTLVPIPRLPPAPTTTRLPDIPSAHGTDTGGIVSIQIKRNLSLSLSSSDYDDRQK